MSCMSLRYRKLLSGIFFGASCLLTAAAIDGASAGYRAGCANISHVAGYAGIFTILVSCAGWMALLVYGAIIVGVLRPTLGKICLYFVVALLPICAGLVAHWTIGSDYSRSYQQWILREVKAEPIQAWLATQAMPTTEPKELPEADWPAAIRDLHPERVDLWKDRGVVLTWGVVGHDGDRREVFIARQADSSPPLEMLWVDNKSPYAWTKIDSGWPGTWANVKPAVWYWILGQA
jgi:hypothetical protein